jgi:hypothetical protein
MDELDQKVYGGKRVSREDMAANVLAVASDDSDSDEEVESYDDEEDREDEDDEEEMEGESIEDDEEIES